MYAHIPARGPRARNEPQRDSWRGATDEGHLCGGVPAGGVTFPLRGKSPKAHQRGPIPRRSPLESLPDGQGRNPCGGSPHWILLPGNGGRRTGDERNVTKEPGAGATSTPASPGRDPCTGAAKGTLKRKRALPAGTSAVQRCVYHPLVYRRTFAPFASAPAAPGCSGGALPRSFPGFSRVRETGPPEASSGQISRAAHPRFPKEAADACVRSIAPPLQTEAEASVWETGEGGRKTLPICR